MQETVEEDQVEAATSEEDEESTDERSLTKPKNHWEYEPGHRTAICLAGEATGYDRQFVLFAEVVLADESISIDDLNGITDESGRFTGRIDLEQPPYDVKEKLIETISGAPPTELKDSKNFVNKCQQILNQRETLSDLGELLYDEDLEGVKSFLLDKFQSEIFPGSELDLTIKIGSNLTPETTDEPGPDGESVPDAEEEQIDEEETGPMFLDVIPEVNPSHGVPLHELSEGTEIEVRVVGDSVSELREQFRCDDETSHEPKSKPLYSKLIDLESSGNSSESRFVVKITNDVYGSGNVDANTMVELRTEDDIPSHIQLRRKILNVLVGLLIFVFSASLLILLFPESFFSLLALF